MTKSQFKKDLQAEINAAGFSQNRIESIKDIDAHTVIRFKTPVHPNSALVQWLNKRFSNGVSISSGTDSNIVIINTPDENNKQQSKHTQGEEQLRLLIQNAMHSAHGYKYQNSITIDEFIENYINTRFKGANAQRIVTAVNMRDKLQDALQMICNYASQKKFDMNVLKQMAEQGKELAQQAEQK